MAGFNIASWSVESTPSLLSQQSHKSVPSALILEKYCQVLEVSIPACQISIGLCYVKTIRVNRGAQRKYKERRTNLGRGRSNREQ